MPGLARVAAPAEELHGVGGHPHRRVRRGPLGERRDGSPTSAPPRSVARRGRLAGQRPRRGHLAGHLGDHEAEPLELGERRAERRPLAEVRRGLLERRAGEPEQAAAIAIRPSPSAESATR